MGRAKISLEMQIEIQALLKAGFSQRHIGKTPSVSKPCAWNVAKKLKQNLPLLNSRGQECRKVSITTDNRNVLCLCTQDRAKTS